jgi:hypothetical protein
MSRFLEAPGWPGVSALIALIVLFLGLYDRMGKGTGPVIRTALGLAGFAAIGASYGVVLMAALMGLGNVLSLLGIVQLQGGLGDQLTMLSSVKVGYWGFFNPDDPPVIRQLGALGLWYGSLMIALVFALYGLSRDFDVRKINPVHLYIPFAVLILICWIGLINAVAMSRGVE